MRSHTSHAVVTMVPTRPADSSTNSPIPTPSRYLNVRAPAAGSSSHVRAPAVGSSLRIRPLHTDRPATSNSSRRPTVFPLATPYRSSTSLAAPSIHSQQSTAGVPTYARTADILQRMSSNTIGTLLDHERQFSRNRAMDKVSFRSEFPSSKAELRHVFTLSKNFVLAHPDFKWSGIGDDLVSDDFVLFNTCAVQAVGIVLRSIEGRPDVHDYGIGKYQAHISMWATQDIILEPHKFRRRSRPWTKEMFGLSDDPNKAADNAEIVRQAVADGWFIRNPVIPFGIIQCFFMGEHRGVAWQSEKLSRDITIGRGDLPFRLWSECTPRSIVPMGFMIVSVVLCMILTLLKRTIFRLVIIFSSGKRADGSGPASQTGIAFIIDRTSSIARRRGPPSKSCARCWSNCE
jgi:hypothetical protein